MDQPGLAGDEIYRAERANHVQRAIQAAIAGDVAALAPGSVWSHVLDGVQPDGQVSLASAAFAAAIGPVPGGVVPAGVVAPVESGTLAVVWVRSH